MRRLIHLGKFATVGLMVLALCSTSCRYVKEDRLPESGATLEGTVKFNGEPVLFALILVQTPTSSATGRIGEDGKFRIENVPIGDVNIGVNTAAGQGDFQSRMMSAGAYKGPDGKGKAKVEGVKFVQVPAKFHDPGTSGLKTTVKKGPNTYDIEIK